MHQGKFNHKYAKYDIILLQLPSDDLIFHNNIINGALNLNLEFFVNDILAGYSQWESENQNNPTVLENEAKSVQLRASGLNPYIGGVPVIA